MQCREFHRCDSRPRRRRRISGVTWRNRSPTCTSTPSTRCSTVRRASATSWPRPRADGQPAIGITDHGNMYGVLPMYQAAREAGIVPIIGTELYQAYEHRSERPVRRNSKVDDSGGEVEGGRKAYYHLTALAETTTGYRNLIQLSSRRVPRGLLPEAQGRLGDPRRPPRRCDRHHRVPRRARAAATAQRRRAGRARGRGALPGRSSGATTSSSSCRTTGLPEQAQTNPQLHRDRPRDPGAAARDERQPLHAPARRRGARRAAVRADQRQDPRDRTGSSSTGAGHYLKTAAEMRARVRRAARRRATTRCGSPSGPTSRSSSASRSCRASRCPRVTPRLSYLRELTYEGAAVRYGADARAARARAHRVRARRHRVDGVPGVLPRGVGPRAVRACARASASVRAGERGGLVRRVLPAHRRHRPDPLRPAVRAVPESGPQADARHRHGLRLALPRRDDQVRGREVRLGPRRADRHVLDDQGAGRGPRRGAGARPTRTRSATRSPR